MTYKKDIIMINTESNVKDDKMKLLTVSQAILIITERTGKPISPRQLQHEIALGKLKAEKVAGTYFIKLKDIENYKRHHPGPRMKKKKKSK